MRAVIYSLLFSAAFLNSSCAETLLRGVIDNKIFGKEGNPYIIDSTITVPRGGKIVFKEGCVVLVNPFCGIDVHGNFIVKGTEKSPVVFTTVNDNRYNPRSETFPQPLDWNGITFQLTSDTVIMENFSLSYSVYGIKSWNGRIVVHNGVFKENGQYDLVVNDQLQPVPPDQPFSYNYTPPSEDTLTFQVKMKLYEQRVQKRKTFTLISFATGLTFAGFDGLAWYMYYDYAQKYRKATRNFDELKRKRDAWKNTAIVAAPCAATALLTSFLLYVIPVGGAPVIKEKSGKDLSLDIFSTPQSGGIVLTIPIGSCGLFSR